MAAKPRICWRSGLWGQQRRLDVRGGKREFACETGSDQIDAELIDGRKLDRLDSQRPSGVDIDQFVVEEESFFGESAKFFEGIAVNLGVRLGHTELVDR